MAPPLQAPKAVTVCGIATQPLIRKVEPATAGEPALHHAHHTYTAGEPALHHAHHTYTTTSPSWKGLTPTPRSVTLAGSGINIALAALKCSVGMLSGSASLIADAGHSLSDLFSDAFALAATSVPHWEAVCTQGIAVMLSLAGATMIYQGWSSFTAMRAVACLPAACPLLDGLSLAVALVSIGAKEGLYRVTRAVGLRCGSSTLIANAHHHRSDAMSSIAAAVGLGGSIAGLRLLDPLAAIVVGGMVLKLGIATSTGEHD